MTLQSNQGHTQTSSSMNPKFQHIHMGPVTKQLFRNPLNSELHTNLGPN